MDMVSFGGGENVLELYRGVHFKMINAGVPGCLSRLSILLRLMS